MEFTVQQIAEAVGGTVEGEATRRVAGLAKIEEAQAGSLTFVANPKYEQYLYTTQASVVMVARSLVLRHPVAPALVRVDDPYSAFTKLLEFYAQATRTNKRGVEEPAYLAATATVGPGHYRGAFSYIGEDCRLGANVQVFPHAYIGDRVTIGEGSVIHAGAKIYADTVIGRFCVVKAGAVVGTDGFGFAPQPDGSYRPIPQIGNVVLEDYVSIGANTTVDCATMGSTLVREGTKIDNLVQVAHNVVIGRHTVIAAQTGISGSCKVGDYCVMAGQVGLVGHIAVADRTSIAAKSGVQKSITQPGRSVQGYPALDLRDSLRALVVYRQLPGLLHRVERLEQAANAPEKP